MQILSFSIYPLISIKIRDIIFQKIKKLEIKFAKKIKKMDLKFAKKKKVESKRYDYVMSKLMESEISKFLKN